MKNLKNFNESVNSDKTPKSLERYTKELNQEWDDDIYTVEEWEQVVKDGYIGNFDGNGYWVKNGLKSSDEVFSTPKLDATHVIWYNK